MKKMLSLLFVVVLFGAACKEFIEPSLSKKSIALLAPSDHIETTSYQQTFWWQTHEDALQYRLQIVSPSFDRIEKLLLDTVVKTDKFTHTLDPGQYQWRVRAENGSSQTPYATQSFTIFPASLKDQSVQLVAPANALYVVNADVKYDWLQLFGTTQYRLQVDKNNFADENNLTLNVLTENPTFTSTLPAEANYQWRVRAENATETSKWSAVRALTFDATPPAKVVLTAPANKQVVNKPVSLAWNAITDAQKYELIIYKSDGTVYNSSYPQMVNTNAQTFSLGNSGETLTWKVRAIDKAGNKGDFSDTFTFTLQ